MKKNLLTLFCCLLTTVGTFAYSVGDIVKSYALPIYFKSTTQYGSITQQIHLASELTSQGGKAGQNISSITFYYSAKDGASVSALSRPIQVWILSIPSSTTEYVVDAVAWSTGAGYDGYSHFKCDGNNKPGTLVYTGNLLTEEVSSSSAKSVKLTFNENDFRWDGTSNIAITICDQSTTAHTIDADSYANLRFSIQYTGVETPRFLCKQWKTGDTDTRSDWLSNLLIDYGDFYPHDTGSNRSVQKQKENRSWVNKIDFAFEDAPAPTVPSVPECLAASSVGTTSASLSWNEASGATSYNLYYSTSEEGIYDEFASPATNSYNWTGLTASTTYYVKVSAVNGVGESDLSSAISFTTLAPHIHDDITFEPWSNASAMPTSGNYYLANDVYLASDWNVTENINLCLNGHEVYTETNSIQVKDGATFAIYDNEGGGRIYGYFVADYPKYGLINIENGGTLVLSEGTIQNLYGSYEEDDDPDDKSLSNAIYNNGTLKLSGALTFTSYHADIYLGSNKYITIESEKPLTNSEPYSVYKSGKSVITSGWANMNGADPKDYFVSANTSLNIKMGETEAEFYPVISLSENNTNTAIGTYSGQMVDVKLTRSVLTSASYNTFCLPFALDDDQLQSVFGADYDLQELTASSLTGETLNLEFTKCTALEAGKPYLLQPSVNVTSPVFEGVTITATSPGTSSTTYVDYKAVYSPTLLAGGNRNLLFLGAGNELFWPESTGNLNGFRAYFEIRDASAQAAKRARISMGGKIATGIENPSPALPSREGVKILRDGKLYLMYKGQMYDVQGKRI